MRCCQRPIRQSAHGWTWTCRTPGDVRRRSSRSHSSTRRRKSQRRRANAGGPERISLGSLHQRPYRGAYSPPMSLARSAFLRASKSRWLAERFMRRPFARRAVKRFMPGEELSDALAAAKQLATTHLGSVITRLGETLTGESQADGVRDHYLGAFVQIQRAGLPAVVSVKPTQLGLDLSFDACL